MRSILAIIAVTLATATVGYAAPMDVVNVTPPNFPGGNSQVCPSSGNSCGVVTFNSDKYVSFGEGICMPLGGNVQSIYVAHCYCTFWK